MIYEFLKEPFLNARLCAGQLETEIEQKEREKQQKSKLMKLH